jgi:hypothetical protein
MARAARVTAIATRVVGDKEVNGDDDSNKEADGNCDKKANLFFFCSLSAAEQAC